MTSPRPVSFVDLIFHHALARPEHPAIILADRVVTYDMLAQGILRVEERIRALDLPSGALVCVAIKSPIRRLIVAAALFRCAHPVINAAQATDLLPMRLPIGAFLQEAGSPFLPGQRQALVDDQWFDGVRRSLSASPPVGFSDDQQICLVSLSSGTTGRPKPISMTVNVFQQWVASYYSSLCSGSWQRLLLLIGMNSSWGFTIAAHALFAGRTVMFASTARDGLQMIAVYGADVAAVASQQLREIVLEQARAPIPLPSLRGVLTGGGLLSRPLLAEARARVCNTIVNLLGSTEAGGTAFAPAEQLTEIEGATGYITPWSEVEFVDENENVLPPGSEGTLRIRATCQAAPYPPERAHENDSFRGGWFYPGDRGRITPDGLLVLTGRTSDVINVGGVKLAPELIEDVLREHPAVTEVAAFGGMGAAGIEEISVVLVVRSAVAQQQIIDWSAERGIPVTHVFIVDSLAKTPSGKLHRALIRQQLEK